jgi:hypothetical protein
MPLLPALTPRGLEHWAGRDLPWSDGHFARIGVEYRNDLLGHLYAFGVTAPPERYHTGFLDTADRPPSSTGCEELRRLGAVLGYSHPLAREEDVRWCLDWLARLAEQIREHARLDTRNSSPAIWTFSTAPAPSTSPASAAHQRALPQRSHGMRELAARYVAQPRSGGTSGDGARSCDTCS